MTPTPDQTPDADDSPLWQDRNLRIIFAVTLMAVLGVSSVTPAFPVMSQALGVSPQRIGWLITAFTLPGVFLTPVTGVLADRWGRKVILVPSLFLFGAAGFACTFARHFPLLLALRFFQGMGSAALGSINITLIGDLYGGRRRSTAMGYNASVLSLGTASYPAIGGALAALSWFYPFVLPIAAIPVGLVVLLLLENPEPAAEQRLLEYLKGVFREIRRTEVLVLLSASLFTFIILYGSYLTYFPFLMSQKFGEGSIVIGAFMSGASVTTAVTASQLGRLTARFGERRLVKAGFVLYLVALLLFPFMPHLALLAIPVLLFGAAQGLNVASIFTLLASAAPLKYRAAFMSTNGMVLRLGQTVGPLIMGAAFGLWNLTATFAIGAVFAAVMLTVVLVALRS